MNRVSLTTIIFILFCLPFLFAAERSNMPEPDQDRSVPQPAAETPERAVMQAKPAAAASTVSKPQSKQTSDTITLELKNMDVVEVIKLLASKGGFDVVLSQNVRGRITLFLDNVPIWDAMQIILQTTELAYTKQGDIYRILTDREYEQQYGKKFHDNREVKIVEIKYASVSEVSKDLKQIKSKIGNVLEDERTSSIILIDTPDSLKTMEDMIAKLDVSVETKVFELIYTPAKSMEEMLKKIISKKGMLHVDDLTNKIIISDTPDVIRQASLLIYEYDKPQYLQTKVFTLNYAKFDKIEEKIKDILTKDVGRVKSDERTNKVVVIDLPEKILEVEKIIAAYDEKSKEVLIEAKIVQVALNDAYNMGINWQDVLNKVLVEKIFGTDTIDMTLSQVFETLSEVAVKETEQVFDNSVRASHPGGRMVVTGTLSSGSDVDLIVDAVKTVGKTNLLSSPRILALNNQEATINVGTREAFVTNTVVQSTSSASTAENVTFVDVGIKLKVTPTIGEDGFITLKIKPEVSNVSRELKTAQGNTIPIIATQNAETTIMVKDGKTIVMGGLIEDQQIKTTSKVPIIGSIPLLGVAFRKESDKIVKNELVIFLTPHIVSGDVDLDGSSSQMMKYLEDVEKDRQKAAGDEDITKKPVPAVPAGKQQNKKVSARK